MKLPDTHTSSRRQGAESSGNDPHALILGIGTYILWGFFPLYFSLLTPAQPLEVIAHRALWGLIFCLIALIVTRRLNELRTLVHDREALIRLMIAGILILVNWSTYVYAILSGHTVDAAIGYFINPLVTVALSLTVRRERISSLQKIALLFGAFAVVYLVVGLGRLPWLSLTLAFSFGLYSLVKKDVASRVSPLAGMAVETATVTPFLAAYYTYLIVTGGTSFHVLSSQIEAGTQTIHPGAHLALLIGSGVLTMIPLMMFATAARGLSLGTLGFIQYLSPIVQLIIGVWIFHEEMELTRWVATGLVWVALAFLTTDWMISAARARRLTHRSRF